HTPHLLLLCPPSPVASSDDARTAIYREGTERLLAPFRDSPDILAFGFEQIVELYDIREVHDSQGDALSAIPYTERMFAAMATWIARTLYSLTTPPFKVIVADCDNTLWDGVVAEDGPEGIRIDPVHLELQSLLLDRKKAGMLLCLLSKNREEDVFRVFERREEMLLNVEDLAACRINWQSKSLNIKELAEELNLGLDSFVLLDDNPVECAEVNAACPEVLTILLPGRPSERSALLKNLWVLDRFRATREDRDRAEYYRANIHRERLKQAAPSFAEFIEGLHLQVDIESMREEQLPRVAQLTRRTNQFNASAKRRTEAEIEGWLGEPGNHLRTVTVSDRFGEYGLVGVMMYTAAESALRVDTLLLSCRVLGRGVEHAMLADLGAAASADGLEWVELPFLPTDRNLPIQEFLSSIDGGEKVEYSGSSLFRFPAEIAAAVRFRPEARSPGPDVQGESLAGRERTPRSLELADRNRTLRDIAERFSSLDAILAAAKAEESVLREERIRTRYKAPRNSIEKQVSAIWSGVLGVDRVGIDDNFFELGGHSLLATQCISRIMSLFDVQIGLGEFFSALTVAELSELIERRIVSVGKKDELADLLEELEALPEDEIERLLAPGVEEAAQVREIESPSRPPAEVPGMDQFEEEALSSPIPPETVLATLRV
ncbi:MAG TPA: HAD-IIIC family phosphatase, partial [Bacteroidetes bacterium]|nr:HAD-IIIC family phosphatase [Bacteroidota bacterium]